MILLQPAVHAFCLAINLLKTVIYVVILLFSDRKAIDRSDVLFATLYASICGFWLLLVIVPNFWVSEN